MIGPLHQTGLAYARELLCKSPHLTSFRSTQTQHFLELHRALQTLGRTLLLVYQPMCRRGLHVTQHMNAIGISINLMVTAMSMDPSLDPAHPYKLRQQFLQWYPSSRDGR